MPTIKTQSITGEQRDAAMQKLFTNRKGYIIPAGTPLIFGGTDIVAHEYKGEFKGETLVAYAYPKNQWIDNKPIENATPHTIYLAALTRETYDYQGNAIKRSGSLSTLVSSYLDKPIVDLETALTVKIGSTLRASIIPYYKVNKDGDTEQSQLNDWDFED